MASPQEPPVVEYIIVFGVSGSGKTSFIHNLATEEHHIRNGDDYSSDIREYPVVIGEKQVVLVDTPGTNASKDILQDLQNWMGSRAISFDSILGIIFLQPITMNRVDITINKQILDKFRGTGKGNLYRRVVLSTTQWSNQPSIRELQGRREQLLHSQLWNPLVKQGALAERYDGTENTARHIVQKILEAPAPDPGKRAGLRDIESEPPPPRSRQITKISTSPSLKSHGGKFVVVLLGPTGSGRSTFIAQATGCNVKTSVGMDPCTRKIATYTTRLASGKEVVLVDTPGCDTYSTEGEFLRHLQKWTNRKSFWSCFGASGDMKISLFLLFHRMEETSGLHSSVQVLATKIENNNRGMLKRIHLVTTFWDHVTQNDGEERKARIQGHEWQRFIAQGSDIHKFDTQKKSSAKEILDAIITGEVAQAADLHILKKCV